MAISSKQEQHYQRVLEMQFRKLSTDFGYDVNELMGSYEKRLTTAKAKRVNLELFYRAELEALELFRKKLLAKRDEKMGKVTKVSSAHSADERVKGSFRYEKFPSIAIHERVPKEMEHLFGALVSLRKKIMRPLLASVDDIRDKSYRSLIYEVESFFDDVANYDDMKLPLVFGTYRLKVENGGDNSEAIDRAAIEVYKMVVNLMKRLKKVMEWLQHPKARLPTTLNVEYDGRSVGIVDFAVEVNKECAKILEIFGLEKF